MDETSPSPELVFEIARIALSLTSLVALSVILYRIGRRSFWIAMPWFVAVSLFVLMMIDRPPPYSDRVYSIFPGVNYGVMEEYFLAAVIIDSVLMILLIAIVGPSKRQQGRGGRNA